MPIFALVLNFVLLSESAIGQGSSDQNKELLRYVLGEMKTQVRQMEGMPSQKMPYFEILEFGYSRLDKMPLALEESTDGATVVSVRIAPNEEDGLSLGRQFSELALEKDQRLKTELFDALKTLRARHRNEQPREIKWNFPQLNEKDRFEAWQTGKRDRVYAGTSQLVRETFWLPHTEVYHWYHPSAARILDGRKKRSELEVHATFHNLSEISPNVHSVTSGVLNAGKESNWRAIEQFLRWSGRREILEDPKYREDWQKVKPWIKQIGLLSSTERHAAVELIIRIGIENESDVFFILGIPDFSFFSDTLAPLDLPQEELEVYFDLYLLALSKDKPKVLLKLDIGDFSRVSREYGTLFRKTIDRARKGQEDTIPDTTLGIRYFYQRKAEIKAGLRAMVLLSRSSSSSSSAVISGLENLPGWAVFDLPLMWTKEKGTSHAGLMPTYLKIMLEGLESDEEESIKEKVREATLKEPAQSFSDSSLPLTLAALRSDDEFNYMTALELAYQTLLQGKKLPPEVFKELGAFIKKHFPENKDLVWTAIECAARAGTDGTQIISDVLKHKTEEVRKIALTMLRFLPKGTPIPIELIAEPLGSSTSESAIEAAGYIQPSVKSVDYLLKAIQSGNAAEKKTAENALSQYESVMMPPGTFTVPLIARCLISKSQVAVNFGVELLILNGAIDQGTYLRRFLFPTVDRRTADTQERILTGFRSLSDEWSIRAAFAIKRSFQRSASREQKLFNIRLIALLPTLKGQVSETPFNLYRSTLKMIDELPLRDRMRIAPEIAKLTADRILPKSRHDNNPTNK